MRIGRTPVTNPSQKVTPMTLLAKKSLIELNVHILAPSHTWVNASCATLAVCQLTCFLSPRLCDVAMEVRLQLLLGQVGCVCRDEVT